MTYSIIKFSNVDDDIIHLTLNSPPLSIKEEPSTSCCLEKHIITLNNNSYFLKKLNTKKIMHQEHDYTSLFSEYYQNLSSIIDCNECYAVIETPEKDIWSIHKTISHENLCLSTKQNVAWDRLLNVYKKSFYDIERLQRCQNHSKTLRIGMDCSIWNYSADGRFFDFDPPKILSKAHLYARTNDKEHLDRTVYRHFNPEGMKMNVLATLLIGLRDGNFNVVDLPQHWSELAKDILLKSLENSENTDKSAINALKYNKNIDAPFKKHPVNIINDLIQNQIPKI